MIRCGGDGGLYDAFMEHGVVAIGFENLDLTAAHSRDDVRRLLVAVKSGASAQSVSILNKFRNKVQLGDMVITYSKAIRQYRVGEVTSDYRFDPNLIPGVRHIRSVKWYGSAARDQLSVTARNTLGAVLTMFEPGEDVRREFEALLSGRPAAPPADDIEASEEVDDSDEFRFLRENTEERAHEFIKDQISRLAWDDMQELVAAILRAMGFKTRVSPAGSDRGKDIIASPDGLGLSPPRIKVEVKHRPASQMGAPEIRSFLGALRGEDRGMYVSTGGFTREAHYEAERSALPVSLVDLDTLAQLLVQHYEALDLDGKSLVPLTRIYVPARE